MEGGWGSNKERERERERKREIAREKKKRIYLYTSILSLPNTFISSPCASLTVTLKSLPRYQTSP